MIIYNQPQYSYKNIGSMAHRFNISQSSKGGASQHKKPQKNHLKFEDIKINSTLLQL